MTRTQLTKLQFDYMDSLVEIKQAEAFDNAIRNFIIDLVEEGFDLNQVRQYMKEREERIFFEFRGYDNDQD
jgi:uncharacterized protein YbcC (UPF0753/DUF2309 family)